MLTPGDVRALLKRHGLAPHKAMGQNFVVDANTVRKVVRDAGVTGADHIVEVGPGLGSLTLALRDTGAPVTAVEIDAGMVRALREVIDDDDGVRIVHADALQVDYRSLVETPGTAILVANLPYSTATPIVMTALRSGVFARLFVMVQREVGERWTARVGQPLYAGVSVRMQALAAARVVARVSRRAFYPEPKVDSVTVAITPQSPPGDVGLDELLALVDTGFAHRRKQLRNTLAAEGVTPAAVAAALAAVGAGSTARAEELELEQWVELTRRLR